MADEPAAPSGKGAKELLTRKIGPLPVWVWAGIGLAFWFWFYENGKKAANKGPQVTDPAGNVCSAVNPSTGFCPSTPQDTEALAAAENQNGQSGTSPGDATVLPAPAPTTPGSTATVPQVVGMDVQQARAALNKVGLNQNGAINGTVTAQLPAAGSTVAAGSNVTLTARTSGKGKPPPKTGSGEVKVPNLVGLRLDAALTLVKQAGLTTDTAHTVPGVTQTVTAQAPKAGTVVKRGSDVSISTSKTPARVPSKQPRKPPPKDGGPPG